jgi:hypothetical protein
MENITGSGSVYIGRHGIIGNDNTLISDSTVDTATFQGEGAPRLKEIVQTLGAGVRHAPEGVLSEYGKTDLLRCLDDVTGELRKAPEQQDRKKVAFWMEKIAAALKGLPMLVKAALDAKSLLGIG